MTFIINMTHNQTGRSKVIKLQATSFEEAKVMASKKFLDYTVGRVCSDTHDETFFKTLKGLKSEL